MTSNLLRWTALAGLAALIAFALPAAAEYYEGKPECPPDMACTLSAPPGDGTEAAEPSSPPPSHLGSEPTPPQSYGPGDCIDCTGPVDDVGTDPPTRGDGAEDCVDWCPRTDGPSGDCGGEVCAHDGVKGPPPSNGGTCMDGAEPWEICDRDVQYLGGTGGSGQPEPIVGHGEAPAGGHAEAQSLGASAATVPGVVGLAFAASAGAALLVARRKH